MAIWLEANGYCSSYISYLTSTNPTWPNGDPFDQPEQIG